MTPVCRITDLISAMMRRGEPIASSIVISSDIAQELLKDLSANMRVDKYSSTPMFSHKNTVIHTIWGPLTIELTPNKTNYIANNGRTLEDIVAEEILLGEYDEQNPIHR